MMNAGLSTCLRDDAKVQEDLNKICEYVKEDLFYKVIFVYDDAQLAEGSVLHKDFIDKCKPMIADGALITAPEEDAQAYLKYIWTLMVKDKCYRDWLSLKCSNAYQAVQDRFMSKCSSSMHCHCLVLFSWMIYH